MMATKLGEARADRMRQMIVFEQFVKPVPQVRVADRAFARNGSHDLSLHDNTMCAG